MELEHIRVFRDWEWLGMIGKWTWHLRVWYWNDFSHETFWYILCPQTSTKRCDTHLTVCLTVCLTICLTIFTYLHILTTRSRLADRISDCSLHARHRNEVRSLESWDLLGSPAIRTRQVYDRNKDKFQHIDRLGPMTCLYFSIFSYTSSMYDSHRFTISMTSLTGRPVCIGLPYIRA